MFKMYEYLKSSDVAVSHLEGYCEKKELYKHIQTQIQSCLFQDSVWQ